MGERPPFVLIWGVSGAGKSQYCQWLAQRGYIYLDNDTLFGRLQQASPLEKAWALMRNGQMTAKQFVDAIAGQRVVVEFGARPDQASLVQLRRLIDLGASAWWFDGDRPAARESWLDRDVKVDEEFWRTQMAWVDHAWQSIADILNARIIRTIGPGRAYLAETQIDRLMFGVLDDQ